MNLISRMNSRDNLDGYMNLYLRSPTISLDEPISDWRGSYIDDVTDKWNSWLVDSKHKGEFHLSDIHQSMNAMGPMWQS